MRRLAQENAAEIEARYPNIMRRVSGYNLDEFLTDSPFNMTKMVVGSEGTLCVITEIKINLVPRPIMTALAVVHFEDIFWAASALGGSPGPSETSACRWGSPSSGWIGARSYCPKR